MKWLNSIWAALLLLSATSMHGQDLQGGVVVHSDPRLSLLVKKPHNMEPTASALTPHKSAVKHTDNTVAAKPVTKVSKKGVTSVPGAANVAPRRSAVKINGDEASTTGHAGGWSPAVHRRARSISSGKGFRVQIYYGPDRNRAIAIKTEFMRNYPGLRTYLTYVSPCFRVKVGDYRTRNEALGMLKEASSMYTPCMIVPDIVNISTF